MCLHAANKDIFGFALVAVCLAGITASSYAQTPESNSPAKALASSAKATPENRETATFGSGCFWCTEAVFKRLKGVYSVVSGYSGGHTKNPTYQQVCSGMTGHAEVVQITFDPQQVSYRELLEVFWKTHDPTTPNRQGADSGKQYRSVIFYHNEEQQKLAELYKRKLGAAKAFRARIVTQIAPFREFYPAEDYHQDYFAAHPQQPYCVAVILPKMEKLEKVFHDKLKQP
jgi:methionine-S-sulfoxide reductase